MVLVQPPRHPGGGIRETCHIVLNIMKYNICLHHDQNQERAQKEDQIGRLFPLTFPLIKMYSQNLEMYSQKRGEKVGNFSRERITVGEMRAKSEENVRKINSCATSRGC